MHASARPADVERLRPGRRRVQALGWACLMLGAWPAAGQAGAALRFVVPAERSEAFVAANQDNPTLPGFDYEVLEGFARLRKQELQVVVSPTWDGLIPMLLEGKADLIGGGFSDTAERRRRIDFSVEVFPSRDVVVTLKPRPRILHLDDLRHAKIVTHRGTSMVDSLIAAGVPPANVAYSTSGGVADQLRAGQATAGALGLEVAILARQKDPNLELGLFLGQPGALAYGLRKSDGELRRALDEYLSNLRRTATWSRLVVKYFGDSALEILKSARLPAR